MRKKEKHFPKFSYMGERFTALPLFRYTALMRKSPCIPIGIVGYIGLSSDDGLLYESPCIAVGLVGYIGLSSVDVLHR